MNTLDNLSGEALKTVDVEVSINIINHLYHMKCLILFKEINFKGNVCDNLDKYFEYKKNIEKQ